MLLKKAIRNAYSAATGMNPTDISIHEPQLQPPPPSGDSNIPAAGIVVSQQPGRRRSQLEALPLAVFHIVILEVRKIIDFVVAA